MEEVGQAASHAGSRRSRLYGPGATLRPRETKGSAPYPGSKRAATEAVGSRLVQRMYRVAQADVPGSGANAEAYPNRGPVW